MIDTALAMAAVFMAAVIVTRCVCVLHMAAPAKHRTRLLFYAFGYSYVVLGAGAIFGAIDMVFARDLHDLALLLMLAGSTGLIVFDRRRAQCWAVTDCPMDRRQKERRAEP